MALARSDQRSWRQWLVSQWQGVGLATALLAPLSAAYWLLASARKLAYRCGALPSTRINAVVCVVGNLVAGGAGKTPTVIALVQHLQASGVHVGVVSRGYGRTESALHFVSAASTPHAAGDEPLLIHRRTGVPVVVGTSRVDAARALMAQAPQTQVVVCDDGLQHFALYRDLEVCVFDDRGTGNGWLLPAGPLREFKDSAPVAAAGQRSETRMQLATGAFPGFGGFVARRNLSSQAWRQDGSSVPLATLVGSQNPALSAVAGIARPERFFAMLREAGIQPKQEVALPDHYKFATPLPPEVAQHSIVCTEKDAAKIWALHPQALAVGLEQTMDDKFWRSFDALVQAALAARISSAHGHKTA